MSAATRSRARSTLALLSLLLSAGCEAGSGSAPSINVGEYSVESFHYEDPYPEPFHPLGDPLFAALRRDEVGVFVPDKGWIPGGSWMRDDVSAGFAESGITTPWGSAVPHDAAAGRFDDDAIQDVAVLVREADGAWVVWVLRPKGPFSATIGAFKVAPAGSSYLAMRIEAGDVDGDSRDELILSAPTNVGPSWVRVYEDLAQSDGALLFEFPVSGSNDIRATTGQLDDDVPRELVVYHGFHDDVNVVVLDDALTGFAALGTLDGLYESDSAEVLTGNFDDDVYDEIAVFYDGKPGAPPFIPDKIAVTLHDDALAGFERFEAEEVVDGQGMWNAQALDRRRSIVVADTNLDGKDEISWLMLTEEDVDEGLFAVPGWRLALHRWSPSDYDVLTLEEDVWIHFFGGGGLGAMPEGSGLTVADDDADGRAELIVTAALREDGNARVKTFGVMDVNETIKVYSVTTKSGGWAETLTPVPVGGDFDGDGTVLRWTGQKLLCLPNPIPICALSAPPTKAGIAQNVGDTQVSYGLQTSTTESFEVTTGTSYSTTVGFEAADVFGTVSASATTTLAMQMESTLGQETSITKTKEFLGSYDHDYIVFQGTLYTCYEYEVMSAADPAAVGSLVAFNVPVDTKTFKWTLDFYNETFADGGAIDRAAVLGHTFGDPASYARRDDLLALLDSNGGSYQGWEGESQTVGQGTSSVGFGLAIGDVVSSSESVTYSVEASTELKVGGAIFGASYGVSESTLYSVSVSHETSYDATIGDIAEPHDWNDWAYDTGLVAYTREEPGELPFQVVRFWVDPFGTAYTH